jgi:hypothetical protein
VALENYSRGQKIFMAVFITLLAGTFTVSAAMITVFEQGGAGATVNRGIIDGQEIRTMEFQRIRRSLGMVEWLDGNIRPFSDDPPEPIYAQVPAMSPRPETGHEWPFLATEPSMVSLLNIWPRYQDQHVWCHMVMARRARQAGVQPPSNAYVGRVLTRIINATIESEFERIQPGVQGQLEDHLRKNFAINLEELVPTVREALMVRDYVDSLLADERARLDQIALINEGNRLEKRAEYLRLPIEPFMEQAMEDVVRESFAFRASQLAGGVGVASRALGYDRFEEAYDKHRSHLRSEATFRLDIIRAFPAEMVASVQFDEDLAEIVYLAVRDEVYRARASDNERIEDRIEAARNRLSIDETEDWTDEQWSEWEAEVRAEMKEYRTFDEVRADVERSLQHRGSLDQAQIAISRFISYLERTRRERERRLRAQIEVLRKERSIWEQQVQHYEGVRRRYDVVDSQMHAKMRDIGNRLDTQVLAREPVPGEEEQTEAARRHALERLLQDIARELADFDRESLEALVAEASLIAQRLENTLNDVRARMAEFIASDDKRTDDNIPMTEDEVAARIKQFEYEVEAIERRIKVRDEKLPLVRESVERLRDLVAHYELLFRGINHEDRHLAVGVLQELLVELPVRLGYAARAERDSILPESEFDEFTSRRDMLTVEIDARNNRLTRETADTRGMELANQASQFGLLFETVPGEQTWESLIRNERYEWMENVSGAKEFLEGADNAAGATSSILPLPGRGFLVLRLLEKTPAHQLGRVEAHDRIVRLAAQKRARELAVKELRRIRQDIIDRGWDAAVADALAKHEGHARVETTPWFREGIDIPGLYSYNDTDVLDVSTAPSTMQPEQPFVSRIRDIKPRDGVTTIIPERSNRDVLRRPDHDRWAYLLARVVDTRTAPKRLDQDAFEERGPGWGAPRPAELWRNRHLAGSETVRNLIEPARVLEGHNIVLFNPDPRRGEEEESESEEEKAGS